MEALFLALYHFFRKRRIVLFLIVIALFGIAGFLALRIVPEEDITRMISGGDSRNAVNQVFEQSGFLDKIIITISSSDTTNPVSPEELGEAGDRLADTLLSEAFKQYVAGITYKVADSSMETMFNLVYENLPLFLDENDYRAMDSIITPDNIERSTGNNLRNLLSPASFTMKQMIIRDPAGIASLGLRKLGTYQNDENYTIRNGSIYSRDLQNLMMFVSPVYKSNATARNTGFVKLLDASIANITSAYDHNVNIRYFGSAVIAVGNAERLKKDIKFTLTITIILLTLIITFSVKKKKLFPVIFLPAVFGGLMALAVIYLLQGKISVISLSIGTVILAITVDYALHITTHFKHKHSIVNTIKDVSFPIIVCGFATAFEFLTLVFVSSESLHELGILAAVSVITAAFFTMVVIPHILEVSHRPGDETEEKNALERVLDRITNYAFDKNRLLLAFMVVYTGVALFYFNRVGFETDMMKMNYMSDELQKTEAHLNNINNTRLNSVYVVAYGENIQEALENNEKVLAKADHFKQRGQVKSYSSPGSLLMSDSLQAKKIGDWNAFWEKNGREEFLHNLENISVAAGFRPNTFNDFNNLIHHDFSIADSQVFQTLQQIFFVDNITESPDFSSVITVLKLESSMKDEVVGQFDNHDGILVIDRKSVLSQIVNTLGEDFNFIANASLLLILGVLIFAFGRIELGVVTFIPILVSWIWTLGFMGIFGIRFNIFNIIISSFITGLGIDYSIYIMQGLVQGYKTNTRNLLSYKTCILISVMISISGTGVLILAKHPALYSIALISIVGLLSVVLISYTFEPIFFNYLVSKGNKKRFLPVTLSDLLVTIIVFSIFVVGCIFMNALLLLVLFMPVKSTVKRYILHRGIQMWCKIPVYTMLHIKKRIINDNAEDFSKPAIIISNHQSHIDLLLLLMLHPKLIVLTTKWVWNNPIYMFVIRYLDYYPVMEGYGDLTGKLSDKIREGYSVVIFPEGSRSPDSSITRFHKGAFLMAHQLKVDLIPVIIHGAGDCMNKGENHLRGGSVTLRICKRIAPGDPLYGNDYHEMTKSMLRFFRKEYESMKVMLETPDYFRRKVIRNYIYKGPVLEWYTRIKLSLEGNYAPINDLVPREASIVDIGCGYGFLSYMLGFVSPSRKILGIDYDADKIELAENCISKTSNISFVSADATQYNFENADVFILSDVLHYLPEDKQDELIMQCMAKLNEGGKIIIRDADRDNKKRHWGTRYTEFFSTRSGFNKAKNNRLFFFSGNKISALAQSHGFSLHRTERSKLTSNIQVVLEKNSLN